MNNTISALSDINQVDGCDSISISSQDPSDNSSSYISLPDIDRMAENSSENNTLMSDNNSSLDQSCFSNESVENVIPVIVQPRPPVTATNRNTVQKDVLIKIQNNVERKQPQNFPQYQSSMLDRCGQN